MRIGFAFTGAGHLLRESVVLAEKLAKDHEVTVFLSGAAEEVLKMYGLYERIENITGGKYRELATDSNQKFSYPITGRLSLGKYDLLIVSPATANTVSKIVYGIADTLVTNAVAQSGKGRYRYIWFLLTFIRGQLTLFYLRKWNFPSVKAVMTVLRHWLANREQSSLMKK